MTCQHCHASFIATPGRSPEANLAAHSETHTAPQAREESAIRQAATNVTARIAAMPPGEIVKQVAIAQWAGGEGISKQQTMRVADQLVDDGVLLSSMRNGRRVLTVAEAEE